MAPANYAGGSSISHWDETAFPAGDPNSLMSPQFGQAEAIQNIGDITRGLFKDIGWRLNEVDAPQIAVIPTTFSEEINTPDTVSRSIRVSSFADQTYTVTGQCNCTLH